MAEKGTAASISAELSMKWFDKEISFFQKPVNEIVDSLKKLIDDHKSFSSATGWFYKSVTKIGLNDLKWPKMT